MNKRIKFVSSFLASSLLITPISKASNDILIDEISKISEDEIPSESLDLGVAVGLIAIGIAGYDIWIKPSYDS